MMCQWWLQERGHLRSNCKIFHSDERIVIIIIELRSILLIQQPQPKCKSGYTNEGANNDNDDVGSWIIWIAKVGVGL
jgi:hypothetical protein